ncbi:MAG TPA: hypothetical protein VD863_00155 [Bradyrhizobium sp.]|nr:hypothetical protein [Bradyrhizobium sp.]
MIAPLSVNTAPLSVTVERLPPAGQGYGLVRTRDGSVRGLAWLTGGPAEGADIEVDSRHILPVTADLDADGALAAPALVTALHVWDIQNLEIGEAAVVTEGSPLSTLVAVVATWYGASPVVLISSAATGRAAAALPHSVVEVSERAELTEKLYEKPGVAAIDLSGMAQMVDLLLTTLPPLSRLMLSGLGKELLTVDFYNNVHRKGLLLSSNIVDLTRPLEATHLGADGVRIRRACRLLARAERRSACLAALGGLGGTAPAGHGR